MYNKEVQKKAIGDTEPITCRPADLIEPQLEGFKKSPVVQKYKQQDEDVLSYALFPAVAEEFFKYREAQQTKVDPKAADIIVELANKGRFKRISLFVDCAFVSYRNTQKIQFS